MLPQLSQKIVDSYEADYHSYRSIMFGILWLEAEPLEKELRGIKVFQPAESWRQS